MRTGGREVPYAVPQTPRLGCRRRDGIESRLTGRYNGHSSHEIPIETPHSKVRQHADEMEAEEWIWNLAHQFQRPVGLGGGWASQVGVARARIAPTR